MARKRERAFALVVVVLFVVTTFGFSGIVIWENSQNNNSTTTPSTQTSVVGTKLPNFVPIGEVSSLQVTDQKTGTGLVAQPSSTVTVYYTGAVAATGIIFSSTSSTGQPATLALNQVIEGWQRGIPGMKVGGIRQLLIPADEAYGASPPAGSGIPPNSALVFTVTLLAVSK
ncbi:MAG TPA: FKBP-type peptidyl-prolyl cis-trans isomerase [Candidatus Saccharimonadales bacterium]|nr:FKBP-type peptidyl-prolyl cis-trans isomerase [Candidatus Saccharimonadales bacterium]